MARKERFWQVNEVMQEVYCQIRKKWVAKTPEEIIRQSLLQKMIQHLGYPKGLIAVEKKIQTRRFDIVCYTNKIKPLLLIECKAGAITESAKSQALGYNDEVKAPFIAIAGLNEIFFFWFENGQRKTISFIPRFEEMKCKV